MIVSYVNNAEQRQNNNTIPTAEQNKTHKQRGKKEKIRKEKSEKDFKSIK